MVAEEARPGHPDRLTALGQVSAPAPEVLDAARERLWVVVAAEMLAGRPAADGAARRRDAARADGTARPDNATHGDGGGMRGEN